MTESKLIDSSIWLDYFFNGNNREFIESDNLHFTSVISLLEIKRKLIKMKIEKEKISKSIEFIKKRSIIISLEKETTEKAVDISIRYNLPMADSLIYTTAIENNATLITLDKDFKGLKDVLIL